MIGIKSIIYEKNDSNLTITINPTSTITYRDISKTVENELIFKYLQALFAITDDWNKEYINMGTIDGDIWKLSIIYTNGNKKEYSGKSCYPINFDAFERLNLKIINEGLNG